MVIFLYSIYEEIKGSFPCGAEETRAAHPHSMKGAVPRVRPRLIQENREANPREWGCDLHHQPRECYHWDPVTLCQNTALLEHNRQEFIHGSHTRSRFPENAQQAREFAQLRYGLRSQFDCKQAFTHTCIESFCYRDAQLCELKVRQT